MSKAKTAGFDGDDWGKILAVLGALTAFGVLPKKWGTPVALAALLIAFGS